MEVKMNHEAKAIWIKALRSGKYSQSYRGLRDNNGYCCLGVLMDCFINTENSDAQWQHENTDCYRVISSNDKRPSYGLLHQTTKFKKWAGDIPSWIECILINLNDSEQADFNQIANWIEEHQ